MQARRVEVIYLLLVFFNTLASSLIWGVNTLFLLDAGLSLTSAFAANALFSLGQLLFEVPTGMAADDNMLASSGGVVLQPALARAADLWGYAVSLMFAAAVQLLALPFLARARRLRRRAS